MKTSIKHGITRAIEKISSGTFSSDDVKLLYVDLRDFSKQGSITREIGDYVAHPKEKDRGITHRSATAQYAEFQKMRDVLLGQHPESCYYC